MLKASVKCISVHVRLRMFLTLTQLRRPGRLFTNSVTTQSPWRPNLAETRRRQGAPCHHGNKSGMLPRRPSSGPPLYTMCGKLALSIEDVLKVTREGEPDREINVAPSQVWWGLSGHTKHFHTLSLYHGQVH